MTYEAAVSVKNIIVAKGGRRVLDVPNLSVRKGELAAVTGPNGAGKSTLLKTMSLLEPKARGEIIINGEKIQGKHAAIEVRRRMAAVFQEPLLLRGSVLYNVVVGLKLRGVPKTARTELAMRWLTRLKIDHLAGREAKTLSGGEARRVSLARALVLEPDILFLDEPFIYLDSPSKATLISELKDILKETGTTAVMVTHDLDDARYLADRLIVMAQGKIIQSGGVETVLAQPVSRQAAEVLQTENIWPKAGGYACIRSEYIRVYPSKPSVGGGEEKIFAKGTVESVYPFGYYYRLKIRTDVELTALVPANEFAQTPKPGEPVYVWLPPERIHLMPE